MHVEKKLQEGGLSYVSACFIIDQLIHALVQWAGSSDTVGGGTDEEV